MAVADTEAIARGAFVVIARRFPSLLMVENHDDPVEISITMPVQPGLSHKIWLCLQNGDELGFSVDRHFYIEFFPCTKPDRVEKYLDAVTGFLSGRYRILEHYRGTKCYWAQLQKPEGGGWHTIANWATIWIPLWFKKTVKELRNQ
jgi:hypothetical protein